MVAAFGRRGRWRPGFVALTRGAILLAVLPLLALALIVLAVQLLEGQDRVAREREVLARAVASAAEALVADQITSLQSLALTAEVITAADLAALGTLFQGIAETNDVLEGISLWDGEGWNLATAADGLPAPAPGTVNVADGDYFREVMAKGRPFVSPAVMARLQQTPTVFLSVPVQRSGSQRAVLSGALSLDGLRRQLRAVLPLPGIALILVDREGQVFVHPDPLVMGTLSSWRNRANVTAALAGHEGSWMVRDAGGEEVLVASARVPSSGWMVVVQQPAMLAFRAERRNVAINAGMLAVAVVCTTGLGWTLSGRLADSYRRLEDARAQADAARETAERAVGQRDALLATVAHDLRSPLATVRGHVQLLRRRTDRGKADAERLAAFCSTVETVVGNMTGMLDELLDAARVQAGRTLALAQESVDLVALVREAVQTVEGTAERHRVRLESRLPSLVGAFDGPRLQRVLTNLLSNALKYSPDGEEVRITVSRETHPDGDVAVLTVRDQGMGIPAADVPRIFEPFYRAQNVAHRISGIGLGLAGSRQIVEQHGGTIQVESREGHGSTFTVRLPLHQAGGAAAGADGILHAADAAQTAAAPDPAERAAPRPPSDGALRL